MATPGRRRASIVRTVLLLAAFLQGCAASTAQQPRAAAPPAGETPPNATAGKPVPPEVARQIGRLSSPDASERTDAATRLGELGPAAGPAVPSLVAALGDIDGPKHGNRGEARKTVSGEASLALSRIGGASFPPLVVALDNESQTVRDAAASTLGRMGDVRAIPPLADTLMDWEIQGAGIQAMERIDHGMTVEAFVDGLKEDVPVRRERAAWALLMLKDPGSTPALIGALQDPDKDVRKMAAKALAEVRDPSAVEPMIALLGDRDTMVRRITAASLGRMGDPRAVGPLLARLRTDRSSAVRDSAARSLGDLHPADPEVFDALVAALRNDAPAVQMSAAYALGAIGNAGAVPALEQALSSPVHTVRAAAASALGGLKDPAAVGSLANALRDDQELVVLTSLNSLDEIGGTGAVGQIIELLKDRRITTRLAAAKVLKRLTGKDFGNDYGAWKAWWEKEGAGAPAPANMPRNGGSPK